VAAAARGDGQTLNLRAQTNGRFFQSYSMSFVEPWLGGRKANSLSFSVFHSVQTNGKASSSTPTMAASPTRSGNRCSSAVVPSAWASA
jgi:hypothetical protein